jgi:arylsulfatase/arylsulfatase A
VPQRWRNCAAITSQYKLVDGRELYEASDWSEENDVADRHPEVVAELRRQYEAWFDDVSTTRGPGNFDPPLIHLGTPHEIPTVLTRVDWRVHGPDGWGCVDAGHWEVFFAREGAYDVDLRFQTRRTPYDSEHSFVPFTGPGVAHLQFGDVHLTLPVPKGATLCRFKGVKARIGHGRVEAWVHDADGKRIAPQCVDVR